MVGKLFLLTDLVDDLEPRYRELLECRDTGDLLQSMDVPVQLSIHAMAARDFVSAERILTEYRERIITLQKHSG